MQNPVLVIRRESMFTQILPGRDNLIFKFTKLQSNCGLRICDFGFKSAIGNPKSEIRILDRILRKF
jgi:hypothetical protein